MIMVGCSKPIVTAKLDCYNHDTWIHLANKSAYLDLNVEQKEFTFKPLSNDKRIIRNDIKNVNELIFELNDEGFYNLFINLDHDFISTFANAENHNKWKKYRFGQIDSDCLSKIMEKGIPVRLN